MANVSTHNAHGGPKWHRLCSIYSIGLSHLLSERPAPCIAGPSYGVARAAPPRIPTISAISIHKKNITISVCVWPLIAKTWHRSSSLPSTTTARFYGYKNLCPAGTGNVSFAVSRAPAFASSVVTFLRGKLGKSKSILCFLSHECPRWHDKLRC